jgi:hypothetical protein
MADKEYIEREAVEKFIAKGLNNPDRKKAYGYDAVEILSEVHHMDAADVVEVRHERWVDNHCTGCGMMPLGEEIWTSLDLTPPKFEWFMDFCPCCGADMRGERDG